MFLKRMCLNEPIKYVSKNKDKQSRVGQTFYMSYK